MSGKPFRGMVPEDAPLHGMTPIADLYGEALERLRASPVVDPAVRGLTGFDLPPADWLQGSPREVLLTTAAASVCQAALASGALRLWAWDADGVVWYRVPSDMLAAEGFHHYSATDDTRQIEGPLPNVALVSWMTGTASEGEGSQGEARTHPNRAAFRALRLPLMTDAAGVAAIRGQLGGALQVSGAPEDWRPRPPFRGTAPGWAIDPRTEREALRRLRCPCAPESELRSVICAMWSEVAGDAYPLKAATLARYRRGR